MRWVSKTFARTHWADATAAGIADGKLEQLLEVATNDVAAYAPATSWRLLTGVSVTNGSPFLDAPLGAFTIADVGALIAPITVVIPETTVMGLVSATRVSMPTVATGTTTTASCYIVPLHLALAVVLQARDIKTAGEREGDVVGVGDFVVRARPLSGTVRQLIRPAAPGSRTPG